MFKHLIFRRGTLYLSNRYEWRHVPHLFPLWMADGLMEIVSRMPDAPTHWAIVEGESIDIDAVEWKQI